MQNRLLLVDPESEFRHSLAIGLQREGFDVEEASDYLEAENLLRENLFDGVILDIEPTFLDWQTVVELVRLQQPESQILFTSAFNYSEMYPHLLEWGQRPFFVKPFDSAEIMRIFSNELTA